MSKSEHPCGAVPVSSWNVNVWYCHQHQCYFASSGGHTEKGTGDFTIDTRAVRVQFGPFDTATDVQHWIQSQLPGIRKLSKPVEEVRPTE